MSPTETHRDRRLVFVYGTLMTGERNHPLIEKSELLGPARTAPCYELVSFESFPALVRGGQTAVSGEIYAIEQDTLDALDDLEGHPDFYQRGLVALEDGSTVQAYLLPQTEALGHPRLPEGDWKRRPRRGRSPRRSPDDRAAVGARPRNVGEADS